MGKKLTQEEAWELLTEYTKTEALRKHALAVSAVMYYLGNKYNEDAEKWGVVGVLHDLDYEKYPEQHCIKSAEILRELDIDEEYVHAVMSHGYLMCTDVEPQSKMEKTLYAIDELTGLINAVCLMRPSRSVLDLELKSVKKKFKDSSFASGVDRSVILKGCDMLETTLDELIKETILGMREKAFEIGLKGNL